MTSTFSSAELLLMTALRLTNDGFATFSADNLIVEAWKANTAAFGMKEYIQYPDTHRAYSYLCGAKGLVGCAFLCRINGKYALTEKGLRKVLSLLGEPQEAPRTAPGGVVGVKPVRLSPAHEAQLCRVLMEGPDRRKPLAKWTFTDACLWWRLVDEDCDNERVETQGRLLGEIAALLAGQRAVLPNCREVAGEEVAELVQLDAALRDRFKSHLKLLSNRNGG
jgi:hypothetical protein